MKNIILIFGYLLLSFSSLGQEYAVYVDSVLNSELFADFVFKVNRTKNADTTHIRFHFNERYLGIESFRGQLIDLGWNNLRDVHFDSCFHKQNIDYLDVEGFHAFVSCFDSGFVVLEVFYTEKFKGYQCSELKNGWRYKALFFRDNSPFLEVVNKRRNNCRFLD